MQFLEHLQRRDAPLHSPAKTCWPRRKELSFRNFSGEPKSLILPLSVLLTVTTRLVTESPLSSYLAAPRGDPCQAQPALLTAVASLCCRLKDNRVTGSSK